MKSVKITPILLVALSTFTVLFVSQCKPENRDNPAPVAYKDDPYNFVTPLRFPEPIIAADNPLTVHGVQLGRKLFYDPILSGDNTQSCASCHNQQTSFSDAPNQFSVGIDGKAGDKNSMALINMAWNRDFFWDGRMPTLEQQVLEPVRNPVEMHETWGNAIAKLQANPAYVSLFAKAFGTEKVDSLLAARAITQFLKTIVASQSKFQKNMPSLAGFTPDERAGFQIFMDPAKGDCFHCHPTAGLLMTDNFIDNPVQRFHNNGLDPAPPAGVLTGRGLITKDPADNGKFKAPTLLNVELSAPYMHDGRFATLEEVVEFYNSGVTLSPSLDVNMNVKDDSGLRTFENGKRKLFLTELEKKQLVAFLKTLTDPTIATNPEYSKP